MNQSVYVPFGNPPSVHRMGIFALVSLGSSLILSYEIIFSLVHTKRQSWHPLDADSFSSKALEWCYPDTFRYDASSLFAKNIS